MIQFDEDELLPISALQHISFCERQCALIHIEGIWAENRLTVEGNLLHERAHEADSENRSGLHVARGMRLRSLRLGLIGMADVVEFRLLTNETKGEGVRLPNLEGLWRPFPVEYKRGRPKLSNCDEAQLCAQAICLEEMLHVRISDGALFYGEPRRRQEVEFTTELRSATEALALRLRELIKAGRTPEPVYDKKCENCSLADLCLPKALERQSVAQYISQELAVGDGKIK